MIKCETKKWASITQPSTTPSAANYGLSSCADASLIADLGNGSTGPSVAIPSAGTPGTATTGGAQSPKYTFTTDNEGRMTQKGTQAYVYDALNRMAQVTTKESYVYDGHGRRVQITKTSDGKINYPIYGLDGKLLVEDNRQTLQRIEYIFAGGRLVAKKIQPITAAGANNGTASTTTIHTDFLGSPVAETNSAGTVTRVERYTPYGEPSDMQLDAGPGFTGHATDVATGLTYMQQRYFDAEIGRFISPDPVGPEEDFINHFNRYNYAQNNPVRYTDPDGRRPGGCQSGECDKSTKQIKTENQQQAKMQETNNVATAASTTLGTISSAVKQGVGEFATADASTAIKGIANAGTAIDLVGSTAEVVIGINEGDTSAIAHGATTGTISVVPLPPNVKVATLIIDAIVQNVEYVQPNGETVNGWEAVGKHLSNVKYDCGEACW